MRSAAPFHILLAPFLLLPFTAHAASASFFGPIVPEACRTCACSFGGVLQIIQNAMNMGISFAALIATIFIVWGAFLFITSPANPENRSTANKMLTNAIVGILIVLSAWLIVDFVMKTLYGGKFGPWNTILRGGDECATATTLTPIFSGNIFAVPGLGVGEEPDGGGGVNCPVPDESTMVAFPASVLAGGSGKATPTTVQNFLAMRDAALKDGIDLKVTSGYRSDAAQVALWNKNCPGGSCRIATAKPCSLGGNGSNHNSGQALDLTVGCSNGNSSCNTPAYKWLKANGSKWNFTNALPGDPVHWSPDGH